MREVRHGTHKLYKGKYFIVFYDKTDEKLKYMFDNVRDILSFQKRPHTRDNINRVNVELYRALKSKEHFTTFLTKDEVLRVYIIDTNTNDDEEEFLWKDGGVV